MGNVQMEARQIRYGSTNVEAALNNGGGGGGSSTIAALTDVDITTPSEGQVLTYDATAEKWENSTPALSDLSDAAITTPSNGQVLAYNSTTEKWENANASGGGDSYTYGSDTFTTPSSSGTTYASAKTLNFAGGGVYHIIAAAKGSSGTIFANSIEIADANGAVFNQAVTTSAASGTPTPTVQGIVDFGSNDGTVQIMIKGTGSSLFNIYWLFKKLADAPTQAQNNR